jgi:predicted ABC-type ATPase
MPEWEDQGFNSKQAKALAAAESAAMNYEQHSVTQDAWDVLAKQAYDPSGENDAFHGLMATPPEDTIPKDTEQLYKEKGEWNEARRNGVQLGLLDKLLGMKPRKDKPTFVLLGGGAASGKSSLRKEAETDYPDAVIIDPDEIKAKLPEYKIFLKSDPLRAASRVHEESSDLALAAVEEALRNRNDIILDAVSGKRAKVSSMIAKFQARGYMVSVRFVDTQISEAMKRMAARAKSKGRWVPPHVLVEGHHGAADTFLGVMDLADTAQAWANPTGGAQIHEKVVEVYTGKRYKEYREKATKHG